MENNQLYNVNGVICYFMNGQYYPASQEQLQSMMSQTQNTMQQNQGMTTQTQQNSGQSSKPKSGYSYPEQIFGRQDAQKGFFIEDHLCAPTNEEYEKNGGSLQPLDLHSKYSKIQISILNYANRKSAAYNIDPKEIEGIRLKTQAITNSLIGQKKYDDDDSNRPAYTVIIRGGNSKIKGKTPAQAITDDVGNIQLLQQQAAYLNENLAKYPANAQQIQAIQDAFVLYKSGQLKKVDTTFSIYSNGKVPSKEKKDKEGYVKYVLTNIEYNKNMTYPISIEISNMLVQLDQNGIPDTTKKKPLADYTYHLSLEDWGDAVSIIVDTKKDFESEVRKQQRKIAKSAAAQNRAKN